MPEFKEKIDTSESNIYIEKVDFTETSDVLDENNEATLEDKSSHFTLKRGRIPMQKKVSNMQSSSVGEINISAVNGDAIGVGTRKNEQPHVMKSTVVVEKNSENKRKTEGKNFSSGKRLRDGDFHEGHVCECKKRGFSCFIRKFLQFFGLCKKCDKKVEETRSYHRRSYKQKRRKPQNASNKSTNVGA